MNSVSRSQRTLVIAAPAKQEILIQKELFVKRDQFGGELWENSIIAATKVKNLT